MANYNADKEDQHQAAVYKKRTNADLTKTVKIMGDEGDDADMIENDDVMIASQSR
jgi:hypothetical protein